MTYLKNEFNGVGYDGGNYFGAASRRIAYNCSGVTDYTCRDSRGYFDNSLYLVDSYERLGNNRGLSFDKQWFDSEGAL